MIHKFLQIVILVKDCNSFKALHASGEVILRFRNLKHHLLYHKSSLKSHLESEKDLVRIASEKRMKL